MKLLPSALQDPSRIDDGLWVEKPGYPVLDGSWIHPPRQGLCLPEFYFEEGHVKNRNEPPAVLYIGSGNNCHVRLDEQHFPERACRLLKEGRAWLLEALLPDMRVSVRGAPLSAGQQVKLQDGDSFGLTQPPAEWASYKICIDEADNWYLDSAKDFPNRYPGRFPCRSSLPEAPQAPEELRRLAWQTDQMRRRSEEDQVRSADWSKFSQYVKKHYYKHGIECTPWAVTGRCKPLDKKPPSLPPRPLPSWICDLLERERQLPGIRNELAFSSCLQASGREASRPRESSEGILRLQEATARPAVPEQPAPAKLEEKLVVNEHLNLQIRDWLQQMDDSLYLLQYHDPIVASFDSLAQIHDIYCRDGHIDPRFFADTGIKKLGHRRIFEKWFRDHCS
eukprot:TRINITY_DN49141_c0_g1_i1.p1 TRINITY_DN49141_c0_g1~~TRINITY_DN49141_c0_g1_i1.p1  ORF type:complete len:393 (+),score=80.41 TRINITY_DN49141_c0_g1_i1:98-1276(+)